ncbi:N-acetylmannosamine-6-phosphate 2-epimerase [Photobacterium sanctipauli]|uniref:Putative N-acetylmannosamine-6-phosphate 2-epimerase n=1 Tax=Photobacterium sanctipauli TaxID=1342794 RepID=A0A2T3NUG5_9GAMM|nr:N-acetylmannosamine-6-phosphate 2-epimerase [Photobacterium sanctipauli]PSW19930.1 N-acetylmannosamine-6-phosphate 2-epimerase [Photobacterium sanctipauli]
MSAVAKNCLDVLRQGFVASCQPVDDGPMDSPEIVSAMAQAAVAGGAAGLRIEGIANLKAVRKNVSVPIIGIVKRDLEGTDVRITPYLEDVRALQQAGADIIAIDATDRVRPESVEALVAEIHKLGCIAMADCATYEEGMHCKQLGVEIIGSTLSGYTGGEVPSEPDFALVKQLAESGCEVMAEGRYNTPELARMAIESGAFCVTVGSAITRIEHICQWFNTEVELGRKKSEKAIA